MDIELLKKLLPGEIDEFLVRNEARSDGRAMESHRSLTFSRNVMAKSIKKVESKDASGEQVPKNSEASASVRLGQTHLICSLKVTDQTSSTLSNEPKINVSLALIKDQSLKLRRDTVEEKENHLKTFVSQKIRQALPE